MTRCSAVASRLVGAASSFVVGLCVMISFAASVRAQTDYANAITSYDDGNYAAARRGFARLVEAGVSHRDLFYNLGVACFQLKDDGCAIYNFEQALRRDAGASDAKANLQLARDRVAKERPDRLATAERAASWIQVVTYFSVEELALALLISVPLFAALLLVGLIVRRARARWVVLALVRTLGVATLATVGLFVSARHHQDRVVHGIVVSSTVELRAAANEFSVIRAPLHAGLPVQILGHEGAWLEVRLHGGGRGWVRRDAIGILD